jgi:hypothetical protein
MQRKEHDPLFWLGLMIRHVPTPTALQIHRYSFYTKCLCALTTSNERHS